MAPEQRLQRSHDAEEDKFDPGYYQSVLCVSFCLFWETGAETSGHRGDFVYDEEIQEILRWSQPDLEDPSLPDEDFFTDKEKAMIASLPPAPGPSLFLMDSPSSY